MLSFVRVPLAFACLSVAAAQAHAQGAPQFRVPMIPFSSPYFALADFDSDDAPDLVSFSYGRFEFASNGGDGAFRDFDSQITGDGAFLITADFDDDGHADLFEFRGNGVGLRKGHGDGTFDPPGALIGIIPATGEHSVLLDLEHDGDMDVAFVTTNGSIYTLTNDGSGVFAPALVSTFALNPSGFVHADLDADGLEDLFVADITSAQLVHFRALPGGGFQLSGATAISSAVITAGDLDSDGDRDLVSVQKIGAELRVWRNDGNGVWSAGATWYLSGPATHALIDDWSGDGRADVVVAGVNSFGPVVRCVTGVGFAQPWSIQISVIGLAAMGLQAADLDGDGRQDLVVATEAGAQLHRGLGRGRFEMLLSPFGGVQSVAVVPGDFDTNGWPELAFAQSNGEIVFSSPLILPEPLLSAPLAMVSADFDGDGFADLAASLASNQVQIRLNAYPLTPLLFSSGSQGREMAAGDLDGDGDIDLVFSAGYRENEFGSSELHWIMNQGVGTFGAPQSIDMGWTASSVALGDTDGDGRLDLVTVGREFSNDASRLSVRRGIVGGFGPATLLATSIRSTDLVLGDIDGDNRLDAVVIGAGPNNVSVHRGLIGGTLASPPEKYDFEGMFDAQLASPLLADIDSDGDLDLVLGADELRVLVAFNDGNGNFVTSENFAAPSLRGTAGGIAAFDFDLDNDLDIVAVGALSLNNSVLINSLFEVPRTYCAPTPTPLVCRALIAVVGIPSVSSSGTCSVGAVNVPAQKSGLLFYGSATQSLVLSSSSLCVQSPLRRTVVQFSGGSGANCTGSFSFDFNAYIASGADPALQVGEIVFAQHFYRDPASASGSAFSEAVELRIAP